MDNLDRDACRQHYVPTYTRVWEYPWLIRGLPGGITFWRAIPGQAALTFIAVAVLERMLLGLLRIRTGLYPGLIVYVGVPLLAGWYVTNARLGGKRLDRWVIDRLDYLVSPKRYDRFAPVEPDAEGISMDVPVCVDDRRPDHRWEGW